MRFDVNVASYELLCEIIVVSIIRNRSTRETPKDVDIWKESNLRRLSLTDIIYKGKLLVVVVLIMNYVSWT